MLENISEIDLSLLDNQMEMFNELDAAAGET